MPRIILMICVVSMGMATESFSQKKKLKDFFKFKNKEIVAFNPEDTIVQIEDDFFAIEDAYWDSLAMQEEVSLERELSLMHEDTAEVVLAYDVPVQVTEQLMIDSVWVTLREYYSVWSTTKVNPYKIDGEKFADTLALALTFDNPSLDWSMPIPKTVVTSPFGLRRWRWHYGDDLRLTIGDSVRSAFDGIVRLAQYDRYGYGHYILVRHYNGLETLYGHLSKRLLKPGDVVKAGDVIGLGGNTGRSSGPHLHFEMRYQGNAFNPREVFDFKNHTIRTTTMIVTPETFSYLTEARKIRYHRVRRGDTLGHISYRYGVSISKICRLNGIKRSSILRVGQRLRIT
ncbi:MAG: M23 family metallopeptidase [Reichenbachiella sp.]|uniref:M23 family metallopeptidase n=1 Tax=Reichenbachiella sp. TaxID=2184521 RepID=UPI0032665CB6